ncbi:MAG: undecaprenyl-diphosphate phosphatase, partial [Bdellovibrionia bacterium]
MSLWQLMVLAMIQGAAELLPVSSSAHVILAEKLMGIDPSTPEMTFFLVMLHTGTMGAVLVRFWPRWRSLTAGFLKMAVLATGVTGVLGLGLKK